MYIAGASGYFTDIGVRGQNFFGIIYLHHGL